MASRENQEAFNKVYGNYIFAYDKEYLEYEKSGEILQQAIDDLEICKRALLNSCLYTTELNSYHNKSEKERLKRAREYAKEYLKEAREELENEAK